MTRRSLLLPLAGLACAAILAAGGKTSMSAAAFTSSLTASGSGVTVDRVGNHFSVVPGVLATGDVDSLAIDLGLVASPGTVTDLFTVENTSTEAQTATLALLGPAQIASVVFAASGSTSVTLAPGATTTVSVTTSPDTAGRAAGVVRLSVGSSTWLYRDYPLAIDAAPVAPQSLAAVAEEGGPVALSWPASATTVNLAGYDVYRSAGGPYQKLNGTPVATTAYTDSGTLDGTTYTYVVRAVSGGPAALESLDSPVAVATADATAPAPATGVALANGGGQGNAYVNLANRASLSVAVTLPAGSVASDVVTVSASDGTQSVSANAPATAGAGTVVVPGLDVTALADGTLTLSATVADAAGNVSAPASSSAPKDTVAPAVPTATYVDTRNVPDEITGTAEANAALSASQTAPAASGPYAATADGTGAYTIVVANTRGKKNQPITVTYAVTATDAAGNTSPAYTLTADDVQ